MRIALYAHGGSGNHGCEALVRSIIQAIGPEHEYVLLSESPQEDLNYHIDEIAKIEQTASPMPVGFARLIYLAEAKLKGADATYYNYLYRNVGKFVKGCDLAISIGGDNYCYIGFLQRFGAMNSRIRKAGVRTILLGCSIEPDSISPEMLQELRAYSLVTVRESITYDALKAHGLKNLKLYPDTAFILPRVAAGYNPAFNQHGVVGLNISPLIIKNEEVSGITLENYEYLISYILGNTNMSVAMIPHVVWSHNDDRKPLRYLYDKFKDSGRINMQDDANAMQLKDVISRCRFMVAARTHASIAAYSSKVPTIVVGYSVKAHGIAKDLFGSDEHFVIKVDSLREAGDLTEAFKWLVNNEDSILAHYEEYLSDYMAKISKLSDTVLQ